MALAVHGIVFAIVAPAMILAAPFAPLFWRLHLMETPGWFAWPKPIGFALAYATWVLALFVLSLVLRARKGADG